jgi:serine/threonine-protein kinase
VTLVISTGPPVVTVPSVVGQSRNEATSALKDAGFEVTYIDREDDSADPGTILAQDPGGDGRARRGSTVTLFVAKRPPRIPVPSVGGLSLRDATDMLHALGLRVSSQDQPVTDPAQDGTVIGQDPPAGTDVRRGTRVQLAVGRLDQGTGQDGTTTDGTTPPDQGGTGPDQGQGNGQGQGGDPLGDIFG